MGRATIIIESNNISSSQIKAICQRNLGALTTTLELNAGDADSVSISIVSPDDNELVSV